MTEIGAERRDMMGNGLAVVGRGLERSDGESVPQVMKARTSCSAWPPQSELAGQLHEDNVSGDLVRSASGRDNEQIVTVASEAGPDRLFIVQGPAARVFGRRPAACAP